MSTAKIDELSASISELKKFLGQAEQTRVKDALSLSIRKLETELITQQAQDQTEKVNLNSENAVKSNKARDMCYDTKITNYAWDQSDKFVKLYVTLQDVHTILLENVKCEFTAKSMELVVRGLNGKNCTLLINTLMCPIIPDGSYFKVKTDMVLIMLKKEKANTWSHVTLQEKKAKEPKVPKMNEDGDPGSGLMDMMKQMYEEGDDEMKRTIAKAWTESRDKAQGGIDM